VLPEGWSVDPISQGASSGGDEFVNADGSERLVVGHGYPEAGETLADRVRVNRSDEVGHGCSSEPKQDRPIRVGGQRGTVWSYTCEADASYHLSAQTIYRRAGHRRVGYRFTVQVPQDRKGQAKALVDRFLAGLTFLNASAATGDA